MDSFAIKTNIIPITPYIVGHKKELNKEAICVYSATGFFLDSDAYYREETILRPGRDYELNTNNSTIVKSSPWFKWKYEPRGIDLYTAVEEFAHLFESIVEEQIGNRNVILPLSGGLDSRTQAGALKVLGKEVHAYGYAFDGGHDETAYGRQIAESCRFPFEDWKVPVGYLWDGIEQLAALNECYSEFTHPRQMAFIDRYASLGGVFSLGHWGDVLFDNMGVPDDLPFEQQVEVVLRKIVKRGGLELASALWQAWGLVGNFQDYLYERIKQLLAEIDIQNSANARIRAFKSLHWAPRWTAVNLSIFESVRPISVPYFDNRMCQFICTVPEKYLAKRQIQIEYLKWKAPELAKIPWQEHRPFNLYTYKWDRAPFNWPYRSYSKVIRLLKSGKLIERNWELQFFGESNIHHLEGYLFDNANFRALIPTALVGAYYQKFLDNPLTYSHSVSMLLTLSLFSNRLALSRAAFEI